MCSAFCETFFLRVDADQLAKGRTTFSGWSTNGDWRSLSGTVNATETRRDFLGQMASGLGGIAPASLLKEDALLAADPLPQAGSRAPHFIPKARRVIQLFMNGIDRRLTDVHGCVVKEILA